MFRRDQHSRPGHLIISRCESQSSIQLIPYDQAYDSGFEDMQRRVPDTSKLRSRTGWSPHRRLGEILDEMIAEAARRTGHASGPGDLVIVPAATPGRGRPGFHPGRAADRGHAAGRDPAPPARPAPRGRASPSRHSLPRGRGDRRRHGGRVRVSRAAGDTQTLAIVGTAAIVCALGLADDLRPLNPAPRMIVECCVRPSSWPWACTRISSPARGWAGAVDDAAPWPGSSC